LFSGGSAATSTLNTLYHGGTVNPVILDGVANSALQPALSTAYSNFVIDYYTTGVTTPTFRDTDGHMTNWVVDSSGRPSQTQECTTSSGQGTTCTGIWLLTNETWDANNNLVATKDARGYETDFAYDANGNTIAAAAPQTTTSQGTFRPTTLYDYDTFNNITAYCDQTETHAAGAFMRKRKALDLRKSLG
jgi:YD repeat-containing protein